MNTNFQDIPPISHPKKEQAAYLSACHLAETFRRKSGLTTPALPADFNYGPVDTAVLEYARRHDLGDPDEFLLVFYGALAGDCAASRLEIARARFRENPEAATPTTTPTLNQAATFCQYLAEAAGGTSFYLGCRDLAAALGKSHTWASRLLHELVRRGILAVQRACDFSQRHATEYVFLGGGLRIYPNTQSSITTTQSLGVSIESESQTTPTPTHPGKGGGGEGLATTKNKKTSTREACPKATALGNILPNALAGLQEAPENPPEAPKPTSPQGEISQRDKRPPQGHVDPETDAATWQGIDTSQVLRKQIHQVFALAMAAGHTRLDAERACARWFLFKLGHAQSEWAIDRLIQERRGFAQGGHPTKQQLSWTNLCQGKRALDKELAAKKCTPGQALLWLRHRFATTVTA